MRRASFVALALRAWPASVRLERGAEMADTLLEASEGSRARFVRELAALAGRGVAERTRLAGGGGPARVLLDGACLAGTWMLAFAAAVYLQDLRLLRYQSLEFALVVTVAAFALAFVGRERLAGLGLVAWVAWRFASAPAFALVTPRQLLVFAVPVVCGVIMVVAPRRGPRRRVELLVALVPLAGLVGSSHLLEGMLLAGGLASLLTLPLDARPAVAASLLALTFGLGLALYPGRHATLAVLLLTAAPIVLAASTFTARRPRGVAG